MPHCTSNFAWYLGKFIAGFTGMLFFYFGFLKEREYRCLCRARIREFIRQRKGQKRPGRCECKEGAKDKIYACGCRKRLDMVHQNQGMVPGERSGDDIGDCICIRQRSF